MQRVALVFAAVALFATALAILLILSWLAAIAPDEWERNDLAVTLLVVLCLATLAVGIFSLRLSKRTTPGGRWQPLATLLWLAAMALLTYLAFAFLREWSPLSALSGVCLAAAAGSAWGLARLPHPVPAGVVLFLACVLYAQLETMS